MEDLFDKTIPPKNAGFEIIHSATVKNERTVRIVIAVKKIAGGRNEFVTWAYINEAFCWGHYFSSFNAATEDFNKRIQV